MPELVQRAEARICAFDIETTKLPLQFPNAEFDQVSTLRWAAALVTAAGERAGPKPG